MTQRTYEEARKAKDYITIKFLPEELKALSEFLEQDHIQKEIEFWQDNDDYEPPYWLKGVTSKVRSWYSSRWYSWGVNKGQPKQQEWK